MLLFLLACQSRDLPQPLTSGEGFFDRPWPSDTRTVDGHPDLSDFPYRGEVGLLEEFLALGETLDGFATNPTIYVRFDRPLDLEALPTPAESGRSTSPLVLLNIDSGSPRRGEIIPVQWDFQETATTWQPENLLAVQPVWGFPLEPATTYALVLTTAIAAPADGFPDVWYPDHADHGYYEPLQETLFQASIPLENVALATIFTTQNPLQDLARIAASIQTQLPMPALADELDHRGNGAGYAAYHGHVSIPLWQHGEKPYGSEGGGFRFDEDGAPILATWERTEYTLTVPLGEMPADGWPVVIHSHGTGGDNDSVLSGGTTSPAAILGQAGLASLSISQPLHGDRGGGINAELYSFNYLNPEAGRTMFRQGALDQIFLAELLTRASHELTGEDGEIIRLDPSRVGYLGHSHGGEVGAMAIPYFGDRVRGAVLSGAGGGLSLTLVLRDSGDFDIRSLFETTLDFSDGEELTTFHPAIAVVQMDAEATDPLNYAPYWHQREPWWDSAPLSVLETEGLTDIYSPPASIEALAGAGGNPVLDPSAQLSPVQDVTGLYDEPTPAISNLTAYNGDAISGGLAQYPDQGHFAVFDDADARELYQRFLSSALNETAAEIKAISP